jgi:hypothetical protein
MKSKYHNQTVPELFASLKGAVLDSAASLKEASEILVELRSRGESHPFMYEGVLRWHREIADGRLSALAVIAFGGMQTILSRLVGLPLKEQDAYAQGETASVAEIEPKSGNVVRAEKPILRLPADQLDLVFAAPGKVRSFEAQRKLLISRKGAAKVSPLPRREHSMLWADVRSGEVVYGNIRMKPSDLAGPLSELGFKIERVRPASKAA